MGGEEADWLGRNSLNTAPARSDKKESGAGGGVSHSKVSALIIF